MVKAYAVSRLELAKENSSRSQLFAWCAFAEYRGEAAWASQMAIEEEFGWSMRGKARSRRDEIVGQYMKALPRVHLNGLTYEHPYSEDVELAALRAHRTLQPPFDRQRSKVEVGSPIDDIFDKKTGDDDPDAVTEWSEPPF